MIGTMRFGLQLAAGLVAGLASASAATASDWGAEALRWTMAEPVTMLDWGMARLAHDIDQATVAQLASSHAYGAPRTGVYYEWRNQRIVAFVSLEALAPDRTAEACRSTFLSLAYRLTAGGPGGIGQASWYLERLFSHEARLVSGMPRDFGDRLVESIRFEIILRASPSGAAAGDTERVVCFGRLDAEEAEIEIDADT
jgi:hypothetical protein